MQFPDAVAALRQLEEAFRADEVRLVSFADSEGHRDYGVSIELTSPSKLGEVERLNEISDVIGKEGSMTTAANGVRIHFR